MIYDRRHQETLEELVACRQLLKKMESEKVKLADEIHWLRIENEMLKRPELTSELIEVKNEP